MEVLERNWWAIGLRGVVAVLVGVSALLRPAASLLLLVTLFGAWWIVDGVFTILAAEVGASDRLQWWPLLVEGGAGLVLGATVYLLPGMTTLALVLFIAAWFVVTGLFRVIAAARLRSEATEEWLMMFSGYVTLVFAAAVWVLPSAGAVGMVVGIGAFALVLGLMHLVLAMRFYGMSRAHHTERAA